MLSTTVSNAGDILLLLSYVALFLTSLGIGLGIILRRSRSSRQRRSSFL